MIKFDDLADLHNDIMNEVIRQHNKFGNQDNKTVLQWNSIIIEEFLEVQKSINDNDIENLKIEIIQTITCLVQLLVKIKRGIRK